MTQLEGTRVLVTGGAGTIGSTLVDQLLDAGAAQVRRHNVIVRETRSRRTGDTIGRERLLENDALVCYDRELVRGTILAAKPGAAGG